jgi:cobalt-zinc-cadmium efflux system membrane fusion protein
MNDKAPFTLRGPIVAIAVIAALAVGAGGTYLWMRRSVNADHRMSNIATAANPPSTGLTQSPASAGAPVSSSAPAAPLPDVVVTMSQEAMKRAGIELAAATRGFGSSTVRIPGTVEPNAYKQVVVTPLVAGRVTRVLVDLGAEVRSGQTLLEVFSPALAEAQTNYLSATAELGAHERELDRTTKLVAIGAASQQELERLHAEHAAKLASVQSLRSRLVLLGMPAPAIDALAPGQQMEATTNVPAPITGVITERSANVGVNVDTATKLFTVVDLSSVWIVGALYERDFSRVHVGSAASVTASAYPGRTVQGRISYIDPQVSPETRTARVRVEVPNPRQELRLGMYADITVAATANSNAVTIPRSAVQTVSDRQVVYIANAALPGSFTEREVRLGDASGDSVEVVSGIQPGDQIVATGSFFVRAERERLGLRPASGSPSVPTGETSGGAVTAPNADVQTASITVGEQAFEPSRLTLRAGVPARLIFLRTTDKTCATSVVFPSLSIRRDLPLNQPVEIAFTPQTAGEIQFVCGMNMLRGTVIVQ